MSESVRNNPPTPYPQPRLYGRRIYPLTDEQVVIACLILTAPIWVTGLVAYATRRRCR